MITIITMTVVKKVVAKCAACPQARRISYRRSRFGRTLLLVLAGACAHAQALDPDWQPSQFQHDTYTREDGLPADVVWQVIQSRQGYLWLGTQNGLVRFDGVRFKTFDAQNTPAFGASDVRAVAETDSGALWAGTYGGGAVHMTGDRFTGLTRADGLADDIVYDIHVAGNGSVWFATAGGLSRLRDGEITSWTTDDGLVANRVFRIAEAPDGALWLATLTGGLSLFDGETFTNFTPADGLDSVQMHMLYADETGLLAGSYTGGLFRLDGTARPTPLARGDLPADLPMQAALRDRDGNLWIGSYGSGLWRWAIGGQATQFDLGDDSPRHIFDLLEDREGNLWLASMNGLHRLGEGLFRTWGAPEGLADTTFVVTGHGGDILVGSEGRGLFRLTPEAGIRRMTTADGLSSNSISALMVDSKDRIWAGTFGGGINIIDGQTVRQVGIDDGLTSDHVFAIHEHDDGSVWIAAEGGVNRLIDGRIETITADDGLTAGVVRHIMEDDAGRLWFSAGDGVTRYDDGAIESWRLSGGPVSVTWADDRGAIWIGMRNGGLARMKDGELFRFDRSHGMPQQSVMAIVADASGDLWLTGSSGLVRVSRDALDAVAEGRAARFETRLYNESDGLRSSQFLGGFQPAGFRADDGRLWFPTNRGLVVIDPDEADPIGRPLDLVIEQVRVNSEPAGPATELQLPATARALEIDYTAPRMSAPERIRFRYRLIGFDDEWQPAGDRRTAYFTGLTPGPKTFEVQASTTGFDNPSEVATRRLELYRAPFWYQTWWFICLALVAMAFAAFGVYRIAVRQSRLRERRLESLVNQRTRELRRALVKVERISRMDGLTGVANRRYFEERLARLWSEAVKVQVPISVIMLDIDRFKQYNDSAGHQAGDDCLRQVAAALESGVVREDDLVARYGGEEFVVLLPATDQAAALAVAERIRAAIADLRIPHPDSDVAQVVTISLGVATAQTGHIDSPAELIERADRALYRAKRAGRNRIVEDMAGTPRTS